MYISHMSTSLPCSCACVDGSCQGGYAMELFEPETCSY